jgi:hypothetical protein
MVYYLGPVRITLSQPLCFSLNRCFCHVSIPYNAQPQCYAESGQQQGGSRSTTGSITINYDMMTISNSEVYREILLHMHVTVKMRFSLIPMCIPLSPTPCPFYRYNNHLYPPLLCAVPRAVLGMGSDDFKRPAMSMALHNLSVLVRDTHDAIITINHSFQCHHEDPFQCACRL